MNHIRHSGIFSVAEYPISLIGAGGIGALTAVVLGKMGIPMINIFDPDEVSEENVATQFYSTFDLESPKVEALSKYMARLADDTLVFPISERIDADTPYDGFAAPVIISAVDSIDARKEIWKVIRIKPWMYYMDARMSAEVFHLYTVGQDRRWYDELIEEQDEASVAEVPCTAKATIYTAAFAAGHIGKTLRMIATGITPPKMIVHDIVNDVLTKLG